MDIGNSVVKAWGRGLGQARRDQWGKTENICKTFNNKDKFKKISERKKVVTKKLQSEDISIRQ